MESVFTDPNPARFDSLQYGDTATFKWVYKITAIAEETATFTMNLAGDPNDLNTKTEVVTMQSVLFAASSKSALDSEGLACCTVDPDLLVFHS